MLATSQQDGFKRLLEVEVDRQRVLVRADLDAPVDANGELIDDSKVVAAAATLRWLLDREAQVVVAAHRGSAAATTNPNQEPKSLLPCAARLAELLNAEVYLPDENLGLLSRKLVNELRPGRLVVLENLLWDPREAEGDMGFASQLAEGIELYVGDCLAGPHHFASIQTLPKLVRERVLGLRLDAELVAINRLRHAWSQGLLLVVAGAFEQHARLLEFALEHPRVRIGALGTLAAELKQASRSKTAEARIRSWLDRSSLSGVEVEILESQGSSTDPGQEPSDPSLGRSLDRALDRSLDLSAETKTRLAAMLQRAKSALGVGLNAESLLSGGSLGSLLGEPDQNGFTALVGCEGTGRLMSADESDLARMGFISTADDAFISLLCQQKLAGVEALRRGG